MSNNHGKVLVVDDDSSIRQTLRMHLTGMGFSIEEALTPESVLAKTREYPFDAVLLDVGLQTLRGLTTCEQLRQSLPAIAIVVLSKSKEENDIVRALDVGADDFVTKPFRIGELAARLRAALRRTRGKEPRKPLVSGEIELDPEKRIVKKAHRTICLTPKEFDLLHCLMRHAGTPVAHAKLLHSVWGPEYGGEVEYLRTYVHQLRQKLESDATYPVYLVTEPWFGYRFCDGKGPATKLVVDFETRCKAK